MLARNTAVRMKHKYLLPVFIGFIEGIKWNDNIPDANLWTKAAPLL